MTFWLSMKNARSKSKSLALKAAATVPQAPSQPQVRHFPTHPQTQRCDTEPEISDTRDTVRAFISHLVLLRASRQLGGSRGDSQGLNLLLVGPRTNELLAL